MAAANASPTYRATKTMSHQQDSRQQPVRSNHSKNAVQEGGYAEYAQLPRLRMEHESAALATGIAERISYQQLGQRNVVHSTLKHADSRTTRAQAQESLQNKLTARALPSEEWCTSKDSEDGHPGKDHEIQHLRTQARSVGVLQELLADSRSEIQALHDVISEQETLLKQHGLQVAENVEDKLARLRVCCSSIPETEWSVELKRPPFFSSTRNGRTEVDGGDQLADLKRQLNVKDEEIAALNRLLRASEDEKGREIALLKEQLQNTCEDQQTSEAICRSLSDETEVLKTRIQRLMEECQGLTRELGRWKRGKLSEKNKAPAMSSETPVSTEDQLWLSKQQIEKLEREKSQLNDQVKEVFRMNKRWQKYSKQQDQVKEELIRDKEQLEDRVKTLELQCLEYEDSIKQLNRRHQKVEETVAAGKEATIRRMDRRVAELEGELEKARRDGAKYDGEVVKQQMKQFTEDFQKEHSEKERLKRDNLILSRNHQEAEALVKELSRQVDELEKENRTLRERLHRMEAFVQPEINLTRERRARELLPHGAQRGPVVSMGEFPTLPQDVQPDGSPPFSSSPFSSSPHSPPISPSHIYQSVVPVSTIPKPGLSPSRFYQSAVSPSPIHAPSSMLESSGRGEDCVDGMGPKRTSFCRDDDGEPLQCPRCLREFPVSKHSDFMRHVESCMDT